MLGHAITSESMSGFRVQILVGYRKPQELSHYWCKGFNG
jgi:hypothetical protein